MPSYDSDQLAVVNADGNSKIHGILDDNGKVRVLFFSFLTTGKVQNDTVDLGYLPKNARLLDGQVSSEALGTSVTLAIGTDLALTQGTAGALTVAAAADGLMAATSHASAATTSIANTVAKGFAAVTTNGRTKVYATIGGANPTTAKQVLGYIRYLAN